MTGADRLELGREAFRQRAWGKAFEYLIAADEQAPLAVDDLELLATAADLIGNVAANNDILVRAYHECLRLEDKPRAARYAFRLVMSLMDSGDFSQGGAWLGRAHALLDDAETDCVEQGYLLLPAALRSLSEGDGAAAYTVFGQAGKIGQRFGDTDLLTLSRLGRGQSLVTLGDVAEGMAFLDEAMVAVTANEVSPIIMGIVYCAVIDVCQDAFDFRRAQEWTAALSRWCESQPDLVPYRGQCLVHRAEVLQVHGAWDEALLEAERACERLMKPTVQPAAGTAFYQLAELHRLRGDFTKAEDGYRQASRLGRIPQPGLALMRMTQGQLEAAEAAVRTVMDESPQRSARARLLGAFVEILVAKKEAAAARIAADELLAIAEEMGSPLLQAVAKQAEGAVLLAEGNARDALTMLRVAWSIWKELQAPYEAARSRVLIGIACRELGDEDSARLEFDAANWVFKELAAVKDLASMKSIYREADARPAGGLSLREAQVIRLVAAGKTNRTIATELFLSEKTVDRHVSNIFAKLGVSTRSAATAFAYENALI